MNTNTDTINLNRLSRHVEITVCRELNIAGLTLEDLEVEAMRAAEHETEVAAERNDLTVEEHEELWRLVDALRGDIVTALLEYR